MYDKKIEKIYVFGAGGMLGRYLLSYFQRHSEFPLVTGLGRSKFEVQILGQEEMKYTFTTLGIDDTSVVINAIGIIPQAVSSLGDTSTKDYMIVNGFFPHYLAFACSEVGARMFHISTDCVFSGRVCGDEDINTYMENSECDEMNTYGLSKRLGEPLADSCSVLRSSLIGEDLKHRSLLQWVLDESAGNSLGIDGYKNHLWNGITCLQLSHILHKVINEQLYWRGVRHFFSPDRISKFELVSIILQEYERDCKVNPHLMPDKIDKCLGTLYQLNEIVQVPTIRKQIRELREFQF